MTHTIRLLVGPCGRGTADRSRVAHRPTEHWRAGRQRRPTAPPPKLPEITAQDLLDGLKHPSRWLSYSGDYTGRRHSPLKQITPENVGRLAPQWTWQAEGMPINRGFESTPLMMDGTMYISGNQNYAWAIDARTGRQIWRYRRALPPGLTYGGANPSNRGFAAFGNLLYMGTLDAHLLALDRDTGKVVWDTVLDDYKLGHAAIAAPLVVKDKVITGNSGGDIPTRGFIDAYDAQDRQARLALLHDSRQGRAGQRDVVARRGAAARRRRDVGHRHLRSRAESDLLGRRQSQSGLLERRAHGRQPLHRLARRARRRHRQAAMAFPVHAARHPRLGLEPHSGARRGDHQRPDAQGGDGRQSQRLLLHARSRDRRAPRRQAVHGHEVGARARCQRAVPSC